MIAIGRVAPDFELKDQDGKLVKLSSFKGTKVLLSFRPLAWTTVCHDQMLLLEDNFAGLQKLNTVALGIGVDSSPSNQAWAKSMNIKHTRLLADFWPHGKVAQLFGVFREADGFSERANIVIAENQKVIFAQVYPTKQLPDFSDVFKALEK